MITPYNVVPISTAAFAAVGAGAAVFSTLGARLDRARALIDKWPGPKDEGRFGSMTCDEVAEIARIADMSDANIRGRARNITGDVGVRPWAVPIFYRGVRRQAKYLLEYLANSNDRPMLESKLIDMLVMGEAAAVRSLVTLFPGDWTTALLKTAAREHPAIRQRLVEMSEEKASLFMRVGWWLGTLTSLPPPLAYLNPES